MMRKRLLFLVFILAVALDIDAQTTRLYDETINPMEQIDKAVEEAGKTGKFVVCQVGGNWCPWCLRFADFIKKDTAVAKVIANSFVYIHVNYPRKGGNPQLMARLGNPARFGFPVLVVLDGRGEVLHLQDSSFLENGHSYDSKKVLRFFNGWTPQAVKGH